MSSLIVASSLAASAFAIAALGAYANYRFIKRLTEGEGLAMKLVSTTTMIKRLSGLLGTRDLSGWEQDFVRKLAEQAQAGQVTQLTGAQVDKLDELHGRHFA
ncbi:hypothetical protein [Cupriavidus sp. DF5525]|uniref:hypothetical protein n=1 Tax=Cupriavidus sp. DF5525 TaxID=3160989 RepID=UPI0032DEAE42